MRCTTTRLLAESGAQQAGAGRHDTFFVASNVSSQPLCSEDGWKLPWYGMDAALILAVLAFVLCCPFAGDA